MARVLGNLIAVGLSGFKPPIPHQGTAAVEAAVKQKVTALTERFPLYPYLG
jgi:glycine hydroxymethyltransferase